MIEYDDLPEIDPWTQYMLSIMDIVIVRMSEVAEKTVKDPHLAHQFIKDMLEFNNKMKTYTKKEIKDEKSAGKI
jgi:RNase P subunit RPR2